MKKSLKKKTDKLTSGDAFDKTKKKSKKVVGKMAKPFSSKKK